LAFQDLRKLFQGSQHTLALKRHCLSSDVERKRMMILLVLETPVAKRGFILNVLKHSVVSSWRALAELF